MYIKWFLHRCGLSNSVILSLEAFSACHITVVYYVFCFMCLCVAVLDHPSLFKCMLLVLVLNMVIHGGSFFLEEVRDRTMQQFLVQ